MQSLCKLLGVTKLSTVLYRPSANGIMECENAIIKTMIASFMDQRARDWNLLLPVLLKEYRSVVHRTLGEAPFDMMFGRPCRLPLDVLSGPPPEIEYEVVHPSEYVPNLTDGLKVVHDTVSKHVGKQYANQKKAYDRHVKPQEYMVGQVVWLWV